MTMQQTLSPAQKAWVTRRANGWKPTNTPHNYGPTIGAGPTARPTNPHPDSPVGRAQRPRRFSEAEQAARAYGKAKADHSALEPVTEFRQVEIDLDDPIVGMGNRRFTVLAQNANKVRLFYAPLLVTTEVDRRYFDQHHRPARKGAFGELVKMGMTEETIAAKLGLAEFRVRWRLQLLNLSPDIRKLVAADQLDRQQAMEVSRLDSHAEQHRIVGMINRRELVGWKATRNAVEALINQTTPTDLFGASAPSSKPRDVATVSGMEDKIDRVVALLNGGWRDGECTIASKVSPDRAAHLADQLAAVKTTVSTMERELRHIAAQAKIAF
jgi:hypothetical protein